MLFSSHVYYLQPLPTSKGQQRERIGNTGADREHVHPNSGISPSLCHFTMFEYLFNVNSLITAVKKRGLQELPY